MTTEEELSPEIYELLAAGHKIKAIKLIRAETGLGLAEAKELADALSGHSEPEAFPAAMKEEGGAGGLMAIVVAVLIAIVIYVFFLSA